MVLASAFLTSSCTTTAKPENVATASQSQIQAYPVTAVDSRQALAELAPLKTTPSCLSETDRIVLSRTFSYDGRCRRLSDSTGCYYYDYRALEWPGPVTFDQREIDAYQLTFPKLGHQWAALAVDLPSNDKVCWVGGAHIGQNPLAMPWGTDAGTKSRKNNFLLSEGGVLQVEAARVHNIHDTFLASEFDAGFDIRNSWISWNRDDFFEGYLHRLSIRNTLVDGTYNFISDRDDACGVLEDASASTLVIEDSLIRIQEQPGPYARQTDKWHWSVEGGHHLLWKLDSCQWSQWPRFFLRNNIFLIEGPGTNTFKLNNTRCNLALPGSCDEPQLSQLLVCENNLFLYTQYERWLEQGSLPGPVPTSGNSFFNSQNPEFLPNGRDCYQRATDAPGDPGFRDVLAIWASARERWISRNPEVARIAGVDSPVFPDGQLIRLRNRYDGFCMEIDANRKAVPATCSDSPSQHFTVHHRSDGKLMHSVLFLDASGRALRTQSENVLQEDGSDEQFDGQVFVESMTDMNPAFRERWYLQPIPNIPDEANGQWYAIESDGLRRSYLVSHGDKIEVQRFFHSGEQTPTPYMRFPDNREPRLQWSVEKRSPVS